MKTIGGTLDGVRLGQAQAFRNLTIFPLKSNRAQSGSKYLLLEEAIKRQALRVEEISQAGSVPELKVVNSADLPVMILDGEELLGAKQNRVLNLTVLVPAHSTINVPVSCVESGRWRYTSASLSPSKQMQYAEGRASKAAQVSDSFISSGARTSQQGQIWADIARKFEKLGTSSSSDSMADMYTAHSKRIEEYVSAFSAVEGQVGAVFAINGRVHGLELFDRSSTFREVFPKFIRAYALDAIDSATNESNPTSADEAASFLRVVSEAETVERPAVGMGSDLRFKSGEIAGGALMDSGSLLHLFAFRLDKAADTDEPIHRATRESGR